MLNIFRGELRLGGGGITGLEHEVCHGVCMCVLGTRTMAPPLTCQRYVSRGKLACFRVGGGGVTLCRGPHLPPPPCGLVQESSTIILTTVILIPSMGTEKIYVVK